MDHIDEYFQECREIADAIDRVAIANIVDCISTVRSKGGRIFFLGVGGSASNASHAVNDFRKLCGIECYAPSDNVSELTARTNDDGWDSSYSSWLETSQLNKSDLIFILSVGGGNKEKMVSMNLVNAIDIAQKVGATVVGVVGKEDGHTQEFADHVVKVPVANASRITPHSEAFQAVIWHCMVSHPKLQVNETKW